VAEDGKLAAAERRGLIHRPRSARRARSSAPTYT
jgi:hypothetical protein